MLDVKGKVAARLLQERLSLQKVNPLIMSPKKIFMYWICRLFHGVPVFIISG